MDRLAASYLKLDGGIARIRCVAWQAVVLCVTSGCASAVTVPPMAGMPPSAPIERVEMTAERYHFSPEVINVRTGTHVIIKIESADVMHGFKIDRYGIEEEIPTKGNGALTVEFYAREPGSYGFKCSHFCGFKHPWMSGKLIVE